MKVFISQPMKGLTDEEVKFIRQDIIDNLKKQFPDEEINVINSLFKEDPPKEAKVQGLWYLGKSLQKMAEADVVLYYNDYNMYHGCEIEQLAASFYGPFMLLKTSDFMSKKSKALISKMTYCEQAEEIYGKTDENIGLEDFFLPESVKEELIKENSKSEEDKDTNEILAWIEEEAKKIPKDCAEGVNGE